MKKTGRTIVAVFMAFLAFTMTVFAEPSASELRDEKAQTKQKIEELESEMTSVMSDINAIEQDLVKTGQQMIKAEKNLKKAEKKEKKQYDAMKSRIVAMYENGNSSMLITILEAGSVADMLQQAENVQAIHAYDRKQLQEYVDTKAKIEDLQTTLEEDMEYLEKRQKRLDESKKELDSTISQLNDKVDDLDRRIQDAVSAAVKQPSDYVYVPPTGTGGGSAIVSAAMKYLGVPYVWGGSSSSGVDCSGLVLLAHRAIGVNLDHYSGSQGSGGQAVSRAEAQPGDVVCYSGHVGIYIGNNQMIHAPQTGDVVRIVTVYGSPWFRRYW